MKSILIEDFLRRNECPPQGEFFASDGNGGTVKGWAIAKPLNYSKSFMSKEDREAMAKEVLDGHAIAIHFTEDEIELGEVPTLYKRHLEKQAKKREQAVERGGAVDDAHKEADNG